MPTKYPIKLVKAKNGCIVCISHKYNHNGYMRIRLPGFGKVTLHKWLWKHYHGEIPEGYQLHHTCINRNCLNIDHLQLMKWDDHIKEHERLRKLGRDNGDLYNHYHVIQDDYDMIEIANKRIKGENI